MVTVTVEPVGCDGRASPIRTTACVASSADTTPGSCEGQAGFLTAQVYYTYSPGATYTAKGSGCAAVYVTPTAICDSLGPISATL